MDFDYSEEVSALAGLAEQIISDKVDHQRLKALEAAGNNVDAELWAALADAGVIGAGLPEAHGGAGLDFTAVTAVLEIIGHHAAALPLWPTVAMVGGAVAQFGSEDQQAEILPKIASGELIAAAALNDRRLAITATADGDGFRLSGNADSVPSGMDAELLLVPATFGDHALVALVAADAAGVSREAISTTTGKTEARLQLHDVAVAGADLLGSPADGAAILSWVRLRADVAICSLTAGLCAASVALMAEYAKERHQFERAIATFQAVSQRAADSYMDAEAIQLTARQAAWRLSAGLPAEKHVAIARYWASEAGFRVVHAATHIHGGVGVDRDYPLHRHYLLARQLELTMGTSEEHLVSLGRLVAAS